MSNQMSAEVIPFPARKPVVTVRSSGAVSKRLDVPSTATGAVPGNQDDAQMRLVRALQALDAALGQQRAAVAAWRGALGELRTTVHGLNTSVQNYRGSLETLDAKVASLRGEAQRLEQWADDAIAGNTGANGRV